ncbi:hypothetical protein [Candidatus Pristimantibacillus sp. PTI5]|uniref:hypothetical protein n=1 Tax=Candidatus Pristimantibacillus sp. PTI5 TaxID=3400422 RepID=UPI003B018283
MNGKAMVEALNQLSGDDLRRVHVLCCDTDIVDILTTKIQDIFTRSKDTDHFYIKMEERVQLLKSRKDERIRLEILLELAKCLEIRGTYLNTEQAFFDLGEQIIVHIDQLMLKDKKDYKAFKETNADYSLTQSIVRFQLEQILKQIGDELDKASPEKKEEYSNKLMEFIDSLPNEKQALMKKHLNIDKLTNETLTQILIKGGAGSLFVVLVEGLGFSFYTTITSLLASTLGLIGITLPFGVYTMLTSTVAILASPVFLVGLLGGGGYLMYRSQNNKLQKSLLPIIILQITLQNSSGNENNRSLKSLVEEWKNVYKAYEKSKSELKAKEQFLLACKQEMNRQKEAINRASLELQHIDSSIEKIREDVKAKLNKVNVADLSVTPRFSFLATEYMEKKHELATSHGSRHVDSEGIVGWFRQQKQNITAKLDNDNLQNMLNQLLDKMVDEVLGVSRNWGKQEREQLVIIKNDQRRLRTARIQLERSHSDEQYKKEHLDKAISQLEKDRRQLEEQVYGLSHL